MGRDHAGAARDAARWRRLAPLVEAHCAAEGVPYTQTTLWESYRQVVGYLNTVGLAGRDPFLCPLVAQRRAPQP
jgi:hypothetical protein